MKAFKNFIAGQWVDASSGSTFENRNPADWNDVIGTFPRSGAEDVQRAVDSAKRGFALWSRTPAPLRGDVLRRIGDLMSQRKEEIADLMTREMGKPLQETRGDVQEGIDTAYYAATEGRRLFGAIKGIEESPFAAREQAGAGARFGQPRRRQLPETH